MLQVSKVPSPKRMKTDDNSKTNVSDNLENNTSVDSQLKLLSVQSKSIYPSDSFTYASTFCNFHLRPRKGLDR